MKHKIALIGFGTVGQGICEILLKKKTYLNEKFGFDFEVVAVCDLMYGNAYNSGGLDIDTLLNDVKNNNRFIKDAVTTSTLEIIKNSNASVICELTYTNLETGGHAIDHILAALSSGKHVVTSNKGPAVLKYSELKQLANEHGVKFLIEGTVLAGTPTLNLFSGPLAGCEVTKIIGILNGTTNFMLSEMEKGLDYDTALKTAQEMGYAEADPTGDVEGFDARAKITILANVVMGVPLDISNVSCRGISKITSEDIENARKQQSRWKLIGYLEKKENRIIATVAPEMLPLSDPLAGVMGTTNALTYTTDLLGDITIIGPGAGKEQTGFAILTDLLSI